MYRHTCSCSTRALEAFIADFAGLSITARPQRFVRRLHRVAHTNRTVDTVSLQAPVSQELQSGLRMIELAPVLEPAPQTVETSREKAKSNGDLSPARSKAENRMLRKLKRIQDGSHNKSNQSEKLIDQVGEMLRKIEESPEVLEGLVSVKKDGETKSKDEKKEKKKFRQARTTGDKHTRAKERPDNFRAKSAKVEKPGTKGKWAKAREEHVKEKIANERAGDDTVEVGDEAAWEHVQDEWTEEPARSPRKTTESVETTRKEKSDSKYSAKERVDLRNPAKERRDLKNPAKDDTPTEDSTPRKRQEPWGVQKSALERKFGETGWQPRKRLSPDTLSGIRALHASNPTIYNVDMLREHFKITPEAIRRILKSKWRPNSEEIEDRMRRWEKRGVKKWSEMAAQGQKPPKKWRELGVPNPKFGMKKEWDSNSGTAGWKARKEETAEAVAQEEDLLEKARRMEMAQRAQRTRVKESLAGRIL